MGQMNVAANRAPGRLTGRPIALEAEAYFNVTGVKAGTAPVMRLVPKLCRTGDEPDVLMAVPEPDDRMELYAQKQDGRGSVDDDARVGAVVDAAGCLTKPLGALPVGWMLRRHRSAEWSCAAGGRARKLRC